jgi:hypothetical protein
MSRKRKIRRGIQSAALVVAVLAFLQRLLVPKYAVTAPEGAMVAEYYPEVKDHDVIFIGDCELYENISPMVLWEQYGINSYIRGSAQQLIWQSYYLAEETFSYETPKVVVFSVLSMKYGTPQREAYNRMTLDRMRWSPYKADAIWASMTQEEHFIEYVFPLLRYHSRWSELTWEDIRYFWKGKKITHNGYYMRLDVRPAAFIPPGKHLEDYSFSFRAWDYLERLRILCQEKGVMLVLVKAPSLYPYWYEEWDDQINAYARRYGLKYYNLLDAAEEIGLDYSKDTYDGGLHLNLYGAEKLSVYLGNLLAEDCGLLSRRGEEALEQRWAEKRKRYQEEILQQTKQYELEESKNETVE